MAKVKDGAHSQLSGKADGLVYVQFNGGVYAQKLPKRKKETWTPGMLLNEQRFKQVNQFCALFNDSVIPQIWKPANVKMGGYAFFLKSNNAAFGPDGTLLDAKKIKISTGTLSFPEGFEARISETLENRIEVNWPKEMNVGGLYLKDELMVISEAEGEYSDITSTGITKADLQGSFDLPSSSMPLAPRPIHLYLFFASRDHRDYSESMCFKI